METGGKEKAAKEKANGLVNNASEGAAWSRLTICSAWLAPALQ